MIYKEIPLRDKKGTVVDHTKVDEDLFEELNNFNWCKKDNIYVRRNEKYKVDGIVRQRTIYLHREIMKLRGVELGSLSVDHINGDRLDNRFCNLRPADRVLQARNRTRPDRRNNTGIIGVNYEEYPKHPTWSGRYRIRIYVSGKEYTRYKKTLEEAIEERLKLVRKYFPEVGK